MRPSVLAAFFDYSVRFESCVFWMYLDVKGYVTVGVGDLIDPINLVIGVPFVHKDTNAPATGQEIRDEWRKVKSLQGMAHDGGEGFAAVTSLRMTPEGVQKLVADKLALNEAELRTFFKRWDDFPADAQMGILSMAWAMGAGFPKKWPKFTAAANAQDWNTCDAECQPSASEMSKQNESFHKRVASWHTFFSNAATVVAQAIDPSVLQYPESIAA